MAILSGEAGDHQRRHVVAGGGAGDGGVRLHQVRPWPDPGENRPQGGRRLEELAHPRTIVGGRGQGETKRWPTEGYGDSRRGRRGGDLDVTDRAGTGGEHEAKSKESAHDHRLFGHTGRRKALESRCRGPRQWCDRLQVLGRNADSSGRASKEPLCPMP